MEGARLAPTNTYVNQGLKETLHKQTNLHSKELLQSTGTKKVQKFSKNPVIPISDPRTILKSNNLENSKGSGHYESTRDKNSESEGGHLKLDNFNVPMITKDYNCDVNYRNQYLQNYGYHREYNYSKGHEKNINLQCKIKPLQCLTNCESSSIDSIRLFRSDAPSNSDYSSSLGDGNFYKTQEQFERERQIKLFSLISNRRIYDPDGPIKFDFPPNGHIKTTRAELFPWPNESTRVLSVNSSKRRIHKACWVSKSCNGAVVPAAVKFVEDSNPRDGRSIRREIECHLFLYQRMSQLAGVQKHFMPSHMIQDAWPCSEMLGYYLDKKIPGASILITRKLSGPDFFDLIRAESESNAAWKTHAQYQLNKLEWCILALERIAVYGKVGIRHNDIKPDNIVLDIYENVKGEQCTDVKVIDLGTASMSFAKDFTGGTSWYESPEQKMREYYKKKKKEPTRGQHIDIDISSDAWGAGLSIAEVLSGRRAVDVMRPPAGPGQLEFLGPPNDHFDGDNDTTSKTIPCSPSDDSARMLCNYMASPNDSCSSDTSMQYLVEDEISTFIHDGQECNELCRKSWSMCPGKWVDLVKKSIGLSHDLNKHRFPICAKAAVIVIDSLVKPNPRNRRNVSEVATILRSLLGKM